MKSTRIARNWWVQWAYKGFWFGFNNEWNEATFIGLGLVVLIYCPKCGARDKW